MGPPKAIPRPENLIVRRRKASSASPAHPWRRRSWKNLVIADSFLHEAAIERAQSSRFRLRAGLVAGIAIAVTMLLLAWLFGVATPIAIVGNRYFSSFRWSNRSRSSGRSWAQAIAVTRCALPISTPRSTEAVLFAISAAIWTAFTRDGRFAQRDVLLASPRTLARPQGCSRGR